MTLTKMWQKSPPNKLKRRFNAALSHKILSGLQSAEINKVVMQSQEFIKESIENGYVAHYTSIDTLEKILRSKAIKFGKVSSFNDVSEAISPTILFSMKPFQDSGEFELFNKVNQYCTKLYDRSLLGVCLSKGISNYHYSAAVNETCFGNFLLWAHYGDRWTGAVLIFEPLKLKKLAETYFNHQLDSNFVWAKNIEYLDFNRRDDQSYIDDVDFKNTNLRDNNQLALKFRLQTSSIVENLMFKKDSIWRPENEWRICSFTDKLDSQFMPFKDALVAVVIGPRAIVTKNLKGFYPHYKFYGLGKASARVSLDLLPIN